MGSVKSDPFNKRKRGELTATTTATSSRDEKKTKQEKDD